MLRLIKSAKARFINSQNSWQRIDRQSPVLLAVSNWKLRLISDINEETVTFLILKVGHSDDVYQF